MPWESPSTSWLAKSRQDPLRGKISAFRKSSPLAPLAAGANHREKLPNSRHRFPGRRSTVFFPESSASGGAGSTARCLRVTLKAVTQRGAFLGPPPPKSRPHPGPRVLDAGGDLSSGSSESHTDVARRDESRYAPGLVKCRDCKHTDSRWQVLAYREILRNLVKIYRFPTRLNLSFV